MDVTPVSGPRLSHCRFRQFTGTGNATWSYLECLHYVARGHLLQFSRNSHRLVFLLWQSVVSVSVSEFASSSTYVVWRCTGVDRKADVYGCGSR